MKSFSEKYYNLLVKDYAGINLTRIIDYDDFCNKQINDSVAPLDQSSTFKKNIESKDYIIDVGFGGGFPILPLAKKLPEKKFIGIETRGKKVKVVSEIAEKLKLTNVKLYHSRVENILINKPCLITFKAVGKVHDFLSRLNLTENCLVYFYKGPNFYDLEKDQLEKVKNYWEIVEEADIKIKGTERRLLIGFKNKNVLCGTEIKNLNQLVKLSDIL